MGTNYYKIHLMGSDELIGFPYENSVARFIFGYSVPRRSVTRKILRLGYGRFLPNLFNSSFNCRLTVPSHVVSTLKLLLNNLTIKMQGTVLSSRI
jgi:hypothetical protein